MDILGEEVFDLISPIPDIVYKKTPKKDAKKPEKKKSSGWFW